MPQIAVSPEDRHPSEKDFTNGFFWSLIVHLALGITIVVQALIFPGQPRPYIPTLRVDLVGLPDLTKQELESAPAPPKTSAETKQASAPEKAETTESAGDSKTKEMVLQAEKQKKEEEAARKKKLKEEQKKKELAKAKALEAARKKKLKSSIDRIKSLAKISALAEAESEAKSQDEPDGVLIKGNQVSAGTSLSADARESDEAKYYDFLVDEIRKNWNLPPWIKRQNYRAKVKLQIDHHGNVINLVFTQPSGNEQFDTYVRDAINSAQPFPKPGDEVQYSLRHRGVLLAFPL